jgi:hypothetical protein
MADVLVEFLADLADLLQDSRCMNKHGAGLDLQLCGCVSGRLVMMEARVRERTGWP